MIGQELGGRYEILERIGGGGMALVYKGHDLLLHRKVAIKVLRQQFVHDDEFIRRFRREAQAAASLSHPNVVSIYDVGQEDEIHYIVMEYIEGQTLNDLIKERAPLQVEEAVHIASQICDALEHAHANQIIHRDIKPHNILIGKNGRVKVTDFGIARATTSSTITQTGSVVGSVHYFSPEHAKGTMTGTKSDLYSLGIVLYQMLTGRLPFIGESPISVALKHLQEDIEDPRIVNPLIPQSVENIILRAVRKNPDERYQSAREMLKDLESCLLPDRRNEARLTFPEGSGNDEEETRVMPAIRGDFPAGSATSPGKSPDKKPRKGRGWIKPTFWGGLLLLTILAMWIGIQRMEKWAIPKDVEIPNVQGQPITDAERMLTDAKLKYEVVPQFNEQVDKDHVISQSKSGMTVKEGSVITLYVSKGVEMQTMPDLHSKDYRDAVNQLIGMGINETQITRNDAFFKDDPKETVAQQSPKANETFDPTKVAITLTVSKGREMVSMPDLTDKNLREAKAELAKVGLTVKEPDNVINQSSFATKGKVFKQWPYEPGQDVDPAADNIILYISSGPPEDARQASVPFTLSPAKTGKPSTWQIKLTDAQHDTDFEYLTKEVSKDEPINVVVWVTKDKGAVIKLYQDNVLFNTKTYTYQNYLDSQNQPSKPSPTPATSPSPTPTASAKPGTSASPSPSGGR